MLPPPHSPVGQQLLQQPNPINFGTRSIRNLAFILYQQGGIPRHSSASAGLKEARESYHALVQSFSRQDEASGNTSRIRAHHRRPVRGGGSRLTCIMQHLCSFYGPNSVSSVVVRHISAGRSVFLLKTLELDGNELAKRVVS